VRIRPATLVDAEPMRAIYNHEVLTSTVTFDLVPRTAEQQVEWLERHSGAHPALVAEDGSGDVVGFGSLSPYRARPAYSTTVEDSIYVGADRRGEGIGSVLLGALLDAATARGFHTVIARIADHNVASIATHHRAGFVEAGVEREIGRKFGRWLDVVVMQRLIGPAADR
jgi:phosphinothricin acetyltransferase